MQQEFPRKAKRQMFGEFSDYMKTTRIINFMQIDSMKFHVKFYY